MSDSNNSPSKDVGQAWEDFIEEQVYPEPGTKAKEDYRDYDNTDRDSVREFYRENHRYQTYAFVSEKREEFLSLDRRQMSVFEALEFLNTLVDDSDPDIERLTVS
ncbi:MAG: inositol oxygenase family protein [Planctomycetota bacterium]